MVSEWLRCSRCSTQPPRLDAAPPLCHPLTLLFPQLARAVYFEDIDWGPCTRVRPSFRGYACGTVAHLLPLIWPTVCVGVRFDAAGIDRADKLDEFIIKP